MRTAYVLVGKDGEEQDYEYVDYDEAVQDAERQGCAVIERQYTFSGSELVWTPDGSTTWPNAGGTNE